MPFQVHEGKYVLFQSFSKIIPINLISGDPVTGFFDKFLSVLRAEFKIRNFGRARAFFLPAAYQPVPVLFGSDHATL